MSDKPQHAPLIQFPIVDNQLMVGGMPIKQLAANIGSTPFYAYELAAIDQRISELRQAMPAQLKLHYAIKANPFPPLVQAMAQRIDGLDVASGGELQIALASGMSAEHISFAGPGKTQPEIELALEAGICINLESEGELYQVLACAESMSLMPRVALRINPDFELKGSGMKMGGGARPFGVDAEIAPALLAEIGRYGLDFQGLHIFAGSQNLNAEALMAAQSATFDLALRLQPHLPAPLKTLNIGGGFGIPYFPGEKRLDIAPIGAHLAHLIGHYSDQLGQPQIVLELGRYLVGEAGVYVCKVVDKKRSRGQTYLVLDGGMHQHLAASGNLGQIIRKNYPVVLANHVMDEARESVTLVGPLCTPLDVLADKIELPVTEPGDLIAILQSGAYGYSASPLGFLGHPLPEQRLV